MYRILCIDGGGVRGIVPVVILQRLCAHAALSKTNWLKQTQLVSGTSTGGLIALGLAQGVSLEQLRAIYEHDARRIFLDSRLDNLRDLGSLRGAQYSGVQLKHIVRALAGDARLRDLKMRVLIPAFDLDNEHRDPKLRSWKPKLFHNIPGDDPSDLDRFVYRVALYTTAGPTYFPSVDGYIDGMVFANNPSMCALIQTQDKRNNSDDQPSFENVSLLSLGTGRTNHYITSQTLDWGKLQWAAPISRVMSEAQMQVVDYQCRQLLGNRYCRVQPYMNGEEHIALDAIKRITDLIELAHQVDIEPIAHWLCEHWL